MSDGPLTPLEKLAAANGIEPSWRDNWGGVHPTSPKTSAGLLAAMGVGAATTAEARRSLAAQQEADWCEPAPPVLVVRAAAPTGRFPIALPRPAGRARRRRAAGFDRDRRGGRRPAARQLLRGRDRAPRHPDVPRARLGPLRGPAARPLPARVPHAARRGPTGPRRCCSARWRSSAARTGPTRRPRPRAGRARRAWASPSTACAPGATRASATSATCGVSPAGPRAPSACASSGSTRCTRSATATRSPTARTCP